MPQVDLSEISTIHLAIKEIAIILLVEASNKKAQQKTIEEIKLYLPEYKEFAYQLYDNFKNNEN